MQRCKNSELCARRHGGKPCTRRYGAKLQRDIIKTLFYADIFNYPLTFHEVAGYLISDTEVAVDTIQKTLKILADSKLILTDGEFYFLKDREEIVKLRKKRAEWSRNKLKIAKKTASKLKIISTIKMIGITGALAMENCQEGDDIDLLIVTGANSLWLTRLLIILLSPFLGIKRRKPKDISVKDKICFNLFLDEDQLKIEPENLFLAHEICQVKPVYDQGEIYEKFVQENKWASGYLPNAIKISNFKFQISNSKEGNLIPQYISILMSFLNTFAFKLQLRYMKPKMTVEKVNLHQAFFHPKDLSNRVRKEFEKRSKNFEEKTGV